ncbi:MAG: AAA family ATPase [Promethearchaeota archaeon]
MTYIKKITMQGFKSFGDRTVSIQLAPGFTCIVGPNGAGKSNVIDALCFCLGRMSKKTMRAKSLSDLIFAGTKSLKPSNSATVKITFDNNQNEFPVESNELEISRTIKGKGGSSYRLNGKVATRERILNFLAQGNIDPDGSNQFVLQGKIVELTHMNIVDRRKFIETLVGLEKYDQMKESTYKELEKAEKDLGKFEAIFKEVSGQLKKYEKEKNDALRWKELEERIKQYNAELIAIKIDKLRKEEEELEKLIEEIGVLIQDLEQKQARQKEKIEQENLVMVNLEDTINEKNTERSEIEEELSSLKSQLSAKETELKLAKENIVKLEERKEKLESLQEPLNEGESYNSLIEGTEGQIEKTKEDINKTHQKEDETDSAINEKDAEISVLETEKNSFNAEISDFRQEISSLKAEIKVLNKNIKKYKKNLKNNEEELKTLKSETESVEEALKNAQNEMEKINQKISEYKDKIKEEKNHQKELENKISEVEKEKSLEQKNLSDINASVSSAKAEIKLYNERIIDLENKKQDYREEYERLSEGKGVEEAVLSLKEKELETKKELADLKKELDALNTEQKKKEQERLQVELQRRAIENEITDYRTRLSGLQTELGINRKDLKNLSREKTAYELSKQNLNRVLEKLKTDLEKTEKTEKSAQKRLATYEEEKEKLLESINIAETDFEIAQKEVDGVLQILGILSQEIGGSVGEIKSDMQNASETSINSSITTFRDYIDDFIDIIKPIEEISDLGESRIKEQIEPIIGTMRLFTGNIDDTLRDIIENVREANDVAVQQSTGNFDTLIQDFIDIIENVHISLKRLTISRSGELHQEMEEISEEIQNYLSISAQNNAEISKLSAQINANSNELNSIELNYAKLLKKIGEFKKNIAKSEEESEKKNSLVEQARNKQQEITLKEKELKEFSDNYWKKVKELNSEIGQQTEVLNKYQDDLRELSDIHRILDNIDSINEEVQSTNVEIKNKKELVSENQKSIETVQNTVSSIEDDINELKSKKDKFWQNRQKLDEEIDKQNELLKNVTDKLRGLQNVQRIIGEIEALNKEIDEAKEKIRENNDNIEIIEGNISEVEEKIKAKEEESAKKREEKEELHNKLKELRTIINGFNDDLQTFQIKKNELSQMKEREAEIKTIFDEIDEMDVFLGEMDIEIHELYEEITQKEEAKTLKIEEIQKISVKREESWEKQKQFREELMNINAQLSAEGANLDTSKNKRINITEKIEDHYEQSKKYGNLPPIPPNETEESLIGKIQKTTNDKIALEPVNLKAIEYYEEVRERFDEIDMRRQTLQRERKAILDSIERIELEKTRTFMKVYHEINRHFSLIFQKLSPGGSAKMILERPESPFEGGISIEARPRGKKISSLEILSGGEKTLVALSFIFAVQTQFASPFYIMDEIDAALDSINVNRVSIVIKEFAKQAQFLVISHREENIMNAEMIYGVSQTDGLTSIFSVDLQQEIPNVEE